MINIIFANPITVYDMNVLRAVVGVDKKDKKTDWGYRNKFSTRLGKRSYLSLRTLEQSGYAREVLYVHRNGREDYYTFRATREGCRLLGFTEKQIKRCMEAR